MRTSFFIFYSREDLYRDLLSRRRICMTEKNDMIEFLASPGVFITGCSSVFFLFQEWREPILDLSNENRGRLFSVNEFIYQFSLLNSNFDLSLLRVRDSRTSN